MQSLRSNTITVPSSLLQIAPPQCLASVFFSCSFGYLIISLIIKATASRSSLYEPRLCSRYLHAGHRLYSIQVTYKLIPGDRKTPGFDASHGYRRFYSGSELLVSIILTCQTYVCALTSTLITTALYCSYLKWFETCSC